MVFSRGACPRYTFASSCPCPSTNTCFELEQVLPQLALYNIPSFYNRIVSCRVVSYLFPFRHCTSSPLLKLQVPSETCIASPLCSLYKPFVSVASGYLGRIPLRTQQDGRIIESHLPSLKLLAQRHCTASAARRLRGKQTTSQVIIRPVPKSG